MRCICGMIPKRESADSTSITVTRLLSAFALRSLRRKLAIKKTIPHAIPIRWRSVKVTPTMPAAIWDVGRTAKADGATTNEKKMIPPTQTPRENININRAMLRILGRNGDALHDVAENALFLFGGFESRAEAGIYHDAVGEYWSDQALEILRRGESATLKERHCLCRTIEH